MTRDEIMAMTPEQLRLAIAEAKGYEFIQDFEDGSKEFAGPRENIGWYYINSRYPFSDAPLPDWPASIAAAWELEGELIGRERDQYALQLLRVVSRETRETWDVPNWLLIHATAEQRSRAWLMWKATT